MRFRTLLVWLCAGMAAALAADVPADFADQVARLQQVLRGADAVRAGVHGKMDAMQETTAKLTGEMNEFERARARGGQAREQYRRGLQIADYFLSCEGQAAQVKQIKAQYEKAMRDAGALYNKLQPFIRLNDPKAPPEQAALIACRSQLTASAADMAVTLQSIDRTVAEMELAMKNSRDVLTHLLDSKLEVLAEDLEENRVRVERAEAQTAQLRGQLEKFGKAREAALLIEKACRKADGRPALLEESGKIKTLEGGMRTAVERYSRAQNDIVASIGQVRAALGDVDKEVAGMPAEMTSGQRRSLGALKQTKQEQLERLARAEKTAKGVALTEKAAHVGKALRQAELVCQAQLSLFSSQKQVLDGAGQQLKTLKGKLDAYEQSVREFAGRADVSAWLRLAEEANSRAASAEPDQVKKILSSLHTLMGNTIRFKTQLAKGAKVQPPLGVTEEAAGLKAGLQALKGPKSVEVGRQTHGLLAAVDAIVAKYDKLNQQVEAVERDTHRRIERAQERIIAVMHDIQTRQSMKRAISYIAHDARAMLKTYKAVEKQLDQVLRLEKNQLEAIERGKDVSASLQCIADTDKLVAQLSETEVAGFGTTKRLLSLDSFGAGLAQMGVRGLQDRLAHMKPHVDAKRAAQGLEAIRILQAADDRTAALLAQARKLAAELEAKSKDLRRLSQNKLDKAVGTLDERRGKLNALLTRVAQEADQGSKHWREMLARLDRDMGGAEEKVGEEKLRKLLQERTEEFAGDKKAYQDRLGTGPDLRNAEDGVPELEVPPSQRYVASKPLTADLCIDAVVEGRSLASQYRSVGATAQGEWRKRAEEGVTQMERVTTAAAQGLYRSDKLLARYERKLEGLRRFVLDRLGALGLLAALQKEATDLVQAIKDEQAKLEPLHDKCVTLNGRVDEVVAGARRGGLLDTRAAPADDALLAEVLALGAPLKTSKELREQHDGLRQAIVGESGRRERDTAVLRERVGEAQRRLERATHELAQAQRAVSRHSQDEGSSTSGDTLGSLVAHNEAVDRQVRIALEGIDGEVGRAGVQLGLLADLQRQVPKDLEMVGEKVQSLQKGLIERVVLIVGRTGRVAAALAKQVDALTDDLQAKGRAVLQGKEKFEHFTVPPGASAAQLSGLVRAHEGTRRALNERVASWNTQLKRQWTDDLKPKCAGLVDATAAMKTVVPADRKAVAAQIDASVSALTGAVKRIEALPAQFSVGAAEYVALVTEALGALRGTAAGSTEQGPVGGQSKRMVKATRLLGAAVAALDKDGNELEAILREFGLQTRQKTKWTLLRTEVHKSLFRAKADAIYAPLEDARNMVHSHTQQISDLVDGLSNIPGGRDALTRAGLAPSGGSSEKEADPGVKAGLMTAAQDLADARKQSLANEKALKDARARRDRFHASLDTAVATALARREALLEGLVRDASAAARRCADIVAFLNKQLSRAEKALHIHSPDNSLAALGQSLSGLKGGQEWIKTVLERKAGFLEAGRKLIKASEQPIEELDFVCGERGARYGTAQGGALWTALNKDVTVASLPGAEALGPRVVKIAMETHKCDDLAAGLRYDLAERRRQVEVDSHEIEGALLALSKTTFDAASLLVETMRRRMGQLNKLVTGGGSSHDKQLKRVTNQLLASFQWHAMNMNRPMTRVVFQNIDELVEDADRIFKLTDYFDLDDLMSTRAAHRKALLREQDRLVQKLAAVHAHREDERDAIRQQEDAKNAQNGGKVEEGATRKLRAIMAANTVATKAVTQNAVVTPAKAASNAPTLAEPVTRRLSDKKGSGFTEMHMEDEIMIGQKALNQIIGKLVMEGSQSDETNTLLECVKEEVEWATKSSNAANIATLQAAQREVIEMAEHITVGQTSRTAVEKAKRSLLQLKKLKEKKEKLLAFFREESRIRAESYLTRCNQYIRFIQTSVNLDECSKNLYIAQEFLRDGLRHLDPDMPKYQYYKDRVNYTEERLAHIRDILSQRQSVRAEWKTQFPFRDELRQRGNRGTVQGAQVSADVDQEVENADGALKQVGLLLASGGGTGFAHTAGDSPIGLRAVVEAYEASNERKIGALVGLSIGVIILFICVIIALLVLLYVINRYKRRIKLMRESVALGTQATPEELQQFDAGTKA